MCHGLRCAVRRPVEASVAVEHPVVDHLPREEGLGFGVQDSSLMIKGLGFKISGMGLGDEGFDFGAKVSRLRVYSPDSGWGDEPWGRRCGRPRRGATPD